MFFIDYTFEEVEIKSYVVLVASNKNIFSRISIKSSLKFLIIIIIIMI